jgi:hypothetical protein
MGTILLIAALAIVVWLFCHILIEIDRRIRRWVDYDVIHREATGQIDGADIIWSMRKKEDRPE